MPRTTHPSLALASLALGGIVIGLAEFATMGLLPEISAGVNVSIPAAGHAVTAYAFGVVVGAPLLAVAGASWPRRAFLVGLVIVMLVGSALTAVAPGYHSLLAARFIAGLPHGAFFGVSALVAVELAPPGRGGQALGRVMLGIPIANIVGVPLLTWLGQQAGWRAAYWGIALAAAVTALLVASAVPHLPRNHAATPRNELTALASVQVWLTLLIGAIGFAGMFAMYSYIAPTVIHVTGLPSSAVPLFLAAFGVGGLVGTLIGGRLGQWSTLRTMLIGLTGLGATLGLFAMFSRYAIPALLLVFLAAVLASLLVLGLQLRLMQVAGSAQTLAAAGNHAALNLANGLGAWLGGATLAAGYGYPAASWVGVGLTGVGLGLLAVSVSIHRRGRASVALASA